MVHLIPVPEDRMNMMRELINTLSNYDQIKLIKYAQMTHFAPLFRNRGDINRYGLITLMAEEFRCIKNNEFVDGNSSFVFDNDKLDITGKTIPAHQAYDNLKYYVGDYLNHSSRVPLLQRH